MNGQGHTKISDYCSEAGYEFCFMLASKFDNKKQMKLKKLDAQ